MAGRSGGGRNQRMARSTTRSAVYSDADYRTDGPAGKQDRFGHLPAKFFRHGVEQPTVVAVLMLWITWSIVALSRYTVVGLWR